MIVFAAFVAAGVLAALVGAALSTLVLLVRRPSLALLVTVLVGFFWVQSRVPRFADLFRGCSEVREGRDE